MKKKIKNALISVSNKNELIPILRVLKKFKIKIISSGGTYNTIKKLGYDCTEISQYTGFKEMLNGRVKTLHHKIHAGILNDRNNKKHQREMNKERFPSIDLIIVKGGCVMCSNGGPRGCESLFIAAFFCSAFLQCFC